MGRIVTKAKTNQVFCSICFKHIKKGSDALLIMRKGKMVASYCGDCSIET